MVVYELVKCEGTYRFPSPFEHFCYGKCLVISILRVKVILFSGGF